MPITSSEPLGISFSSFDIVPLPRSPLLNRYSSSGQLCPIKVPLSRFTPAPTHYLS